MIDPPFPPASSETEDSRPDGWAGTRPMSADMPGPGKPEAWPGTRPPPPGTTELVEPDELPGTRPSTADVPEPGDVGSAVARRRLHRLRRNLVLRLPATMRGAAVDPALRGTLVLALVAVVGAAAAAWFAWSGRPTVLPGAGAHLSSPSVQEGAQSRATPPAAGSAAHAAGTHPVGAHGAVDAAVPTPPEPGPEIVVDVAGMVARPGVVTLPPGSRVVDAVEAAGGVLPGTDTTGLGLARRLADGEQVLVDGRPGPAPAPRPATGSGTTSGAAGPDTPLDLNTATVEEFDGLPGVGPVLAQRIVEWRETHGGFTSADQLGEVTGVGDKRLAELLPMVTVR